MFFYWECMHWCQIGTKDRNEHIPPIDIYHSSKPTCFSIKAQGLGQGWTRPAGRAPGRPSLRAAGLEIHHLVLPHPNRQTIIRLTHHIMANRDIIDNLTLQIQIFNLTYYSKRSIFSTVPFRTFAKFNSNNSNNEAIDFYLWKNGKSHDLWMFSREIWNGEILVHKSWTKKLLPHFDFIFSR